MQIVRARGGAGGMSAGAAWLGPGGLLDTLPDEELDDVHGLALTLFGNDPPTGAGSRQEPAVWHTRRVGVARCTLLRARRVAAPVVCT